MHMCRTIQGIVLRLGLWQPVNRKAKEQTKLLNDMVVYVLGSDPKCSIIEPFLDSPLAWESNSDRYMLWTRSMKPHINTLDTKMTKQPKIDGPVAEQRSWRGQYLQLADRPRPPRAQHGSAQPTDCRLRV